MKKFTKDKYENKIFEDNEKYLLELDEEDFDYSDIISTGYRRRKNHIDRNEY